MDMKSRLDEQFISSSQPFVSHLYASKKFSVLTKSFWYSFMLVVFFVRIIGKIIESFGPSKLKSFFFNAGLVT